MKSTKYNKCRGSTGCTNDPEYFYQYKYNFAFGVCKSCSLPGDKLVSDGFIKEISAEEYEIFHIMKL